MFLLFKCLLFKSPLYTVGIWNPTIWNPETFEIQTFWRLDFKLSGFSIVLRDHYVVLVPTIRKPDIFVRISNGWASGFQVPFKIWTICNPTSFGHLKHLLHESVYTSRFLSGKKCCISRVECMLTFSLPVLMRYSSSTSDL